MKINNIFDNANLYEIAQNLVIKKKSFAIINNVIVGSEQPKSVFDFGCGIGYHSKLFPETTYFGIDPIVGCIEKANKKYCRANHEFKVGDHTYLKEIPSESFELIIAIGVLHHISDEIAEELVSNSARILKPGGRFTTWDPVYHQNQSWVSKLVVSQDRGKFVRTEVEYYDILRKSFADLDTEIYTGLLRIPYDHITFSAVRN